MGTFSFQIWIGISFCLREVVKRKIHKYAFCVFSYWPLPEVKNWFRKQIWNKNVHISIQNFFWRVWSIFKKKKWIFHCIFKKWFDRHRVFFFTKFLSEKAKHPHKYALVWVVACRKLKSQKCSITPAYPMFSK